MRVNLTPEIIEQYLAGPPSRRLELCDRKVSGLYAEIRRSLDTSSPFATFYLRSKRNGKTCHTKLGRSIDIDLDEARDRAKKLKAQITLGMDPRDQAEAKTSALMFQEFFTKHYLPFKARKRSLRKDEEMFRLRLNRVFGDQRLDEIRRQQIQDFHTQLLEKGLAASTANHYLKLMRHALNLAVEWEMLEKNPAARIRMAREDNEVERYLNQDELERLLEVLSTDSNRTVCLICLFLLATGQRCGEVLKAEWKMIDLEARTWRIPATNTKAQRNRAVPLNDTALDVLAQLDTKAGFSHVFVNRRTGAPYTTVRKVWDRIRRKAGLPHARLHDLRHAHASLLARSGRSLLEIQRILGHSRPHVTQRYATLQMETLQDASNSAAEAINGAMRKTG
jgi:integrase